MRNPWQNASSDGCYWLFLEAKLERSEKLIQGWWPTPFVVIRCGSPKSRSIWIGSEQQPGHFCCRQKLSEFAGSCWLMVVFFSPNMPAISRCFWKIASPLIKILREGPSYLSWLRTLMGDTVWKPTWLARKSTMNIDVMMYVFLEKRSFHSYMFTLSWRLQL